MPLPRIWTKPVPNGVDRPGKGSLIVDKAAGYDLNRLRDLCAAFRQIVSGWPGAGDDDGARLGGPGVGRVGRPGLRSCGCQKKRNKQHRILRNVSGSAPKHREIATITGNTPFQRRWLWVFFTLLAYRRDEM